MYVINVIVFVITMFVIATGKAKGCGTIASYASGSFGFGILGWWAGNIFHIGAGNGASICALVFQIGWLIKMFKKLKN